MELHSRVFKVALAAATGLFALIGSQEESAAEEYRYLCTSVPGGCEYAPPSAPALNADVCWNGSVAVLKGAGSCPLSSWPYFVDGGEVVDPMTGEVQAYIKLDDACDLGFCDVAPPNPGPTTEGPLCCGSGGCFPLSEGSSCTGGEVTVWCFEGEEAQLQDGQWVCYEAE
jgi:hypothetical protein